MVKKKILPMAVSALGVAALGALGAKGIASVDEYTRRATGSLLGLAARQAEVQLASEGDDLPEWALKLAKEPGLGNDLRALSASLTLPTPKSVKVAKAVQNRIGGLRERLGERVVSFRKGTPEVEVVALLDAAGTVVVSTSRELPPGMPLSPPEPAAGATVQAAAAKEAQPAENTKTAKDTDAKRAEKPVKVADGLWPLVKKSLGGRHGRGVLVVNGNLEYVGIAPVLLKNNKLVGAVLVQKRLRSLSQSAGVDTLLVVDNVVALGEGRVALTNVKKGPAFRLDAQDPSGLASGGGFPMGPFFVAKSNIGVWAQRFEVPGTERAWGLVKADVTAVYATVAERQGALFASAVVVWLLLGTFFLFSDRRLHIGVEQIADYLSLLHQGIGDERRLHDNRFPPDLRRLVRVVNQVVEKFVGSQSMRTLPKAPSVDDVISAQTADGTEPIAADLEFSGISGAGTLGEDPASSSPVAAAADGDSLALELGTKPAAVSSKNAGQRDDSDSGALGASTDPEPDPSESASVLGDLLDEPQQADDSDSAAQANAGGVVDLFSDYDDGDTPPVAMSETPTASLKEPSEPQGSELQDAVSAQETGASVTAELQLESESDSNETVQVAVPPEIMARLRQPDAGLDASPGPSSSPPGADNQGPVAPSAAVMADLMKAAGGGGRQRNAEMSTEPSGLALESDEVPADDDGDNEQTHFRQVYDEFVSTRKQCGEGGELPFDKFEVRLKQSRDAVLARHACASVRFQVYVKNGKAALKATPAK